MITVVANLKGGSGKSTTAFNLWLWMVKNGYPTIGYDLDPQKTLTYAVEVRQEEKYLPALELGEVKGEVYSSILHSDKYYPKQGVIVDVGASDIPAMKQAVSVADLVVVPLNPSQSDVWATQKFLKIIADVLSVSGKTRVVGVINRADIDPTIPETAEAAEAINMLPGIELAQTMLTQRLVYRRSFSEGLAVFELQPKGVAADEINSLGVSLV